MAFGIKYHTFFPRALPCSLLVENFRKLLVVVDAVIAVVAAAGIGWKLLVGIWLVDGGVVEVRR